MCKKLDGIGLIKIGPNFQLQAAKWHTIASNTLNQLICESGNFLQGSLKPSCGKK